VETEKVDRLVITLTEGEFFLSTPSDFIQGYTCLPPISAMLKPAFSKIGIKYFKIRQHSDFCADEESHFILYECNFFMIRPSADIVLSVEELIGIGLKLGPRLKLLKFIELRKEKKSDPMQYPVASVTFVSGSQVITSQELAYVDEKNAADMLSIDTGGPTEKYYTITTENEKDVLSSKAEKAPEIGVEVESANPITVTIYQIYFYIFDGIVV
jgi:hypothetical protein